MHFLLRLVLVSFLLVSCQGGQLASSSWRKPNITISPTDRVGLAEAGVQKAISMLSPDAQFDGQSLAYAAQLYSQMAEFDMVTNQTKYADTLKQYFLEAPHRQSNFSDLFLDFALAYGHAASRAYAAYNDSVFYDYAVQSWWFGQEYTLSSQEVAAGKTAVKNFTLVQQCQEITMAGGTFWNTELGNPGVAGLGTGTFFVLSALLAEATSDPKDKNMYLQAATASANFIKTHLMNNLFQVQDQISARVNASCAENSDPQSHDAGLAIEGLSILYSITNDPANQTLLSNIMAATIPNPAWQSSDGVLTDGDMYLLRGLTTAYVRESVPDLQDDIGQYIAVQFNAVVDLATANGSNIYANSWSGPPSSAFSPVNQSNALSALIGAIHLHNASDATVIPGAPTASGSVAPLPHKLPTKEIIIASVLGTVALIAGILGIWAIRRRSASLRTSPVSPFGIWNTLRQLSGKHSRETLDPPPMAAVRKNAPVPRRAAPTPRRTAPVVASGQNPGPPPSNFPTEELVRILNERLQSQSWDAEEAPPDYPV